MKFHSNRVLIGERIMRITPIFDSTPVFIWADTTARICNPAALFTVVESSMRNRESRLMREMSCRTHLAAREAPISVRDFDELDFTTDINGHRHQPSACCQCPAARVPSCLLSNTGSPPALCNPNSWCRRTCFIFLEFLLRDAFNLTREPEKYPEHINEAPP